MTLKELNPIKELDYNVNENAEILGIGYKQFRTLYNPNDLTTFKYKGLLFPLYVDSYSGIKVNT